MHKVVAKRQLSPNVTRLDVQAPRLAEIRRAGQFVIVRRGDGAERIPLTIADSDPASGTITLIIQAVGHSTRELVALEPGDSIQDIAGPLGHPTELISSGNALCVGGGVGTAVVHPIAQALHRAGARVTSVIGGRSRQWVIMEPELRQLGEVIVCTDDGSYGRKGFITEAARELLEAGFGALGVELADRMKRPRLEYQVAIYHRSAPSTADCQPTVEVTDAVC